MHVVMLSDLETQGGAAIGANRVAEGHLVCLGRCEVATRPAGVPPRALRYSGAIN